MVVMQGTSKSMPWLADLVESNDSSLDVLPVQCLCEFLLHDAPSDVSSSSAAEDATQVERHKKQVEMWRWRLTFILIVYHLVTCDLSVL